MKLLDFQRYYNGHRTHAGLDGRTPDPSPDAGCARASVSAYRWQSHCSGLYQTPMAAWRACSTSARASPDLARCRPF